MDLRRLSTMATAAERMRRTNRIRGHCGSHKLWSQAEIATLRQFHPNYGAALAALPGRTLHAIKLKAQRLGIARKVHRWTGAENVRLRAVFRSGSRHAIMEEFPYLTWKQIRAHAHASRFLRDKRPYDATGWLLLDNVRKRCRDLSLTMADLDQMAGTKRYFRHRHWRGNKRQVSAAVSRAVIALDGTLEARWRS